MRPQTTDPLSTRQPLDIGATLRALQSAGRLDQHRTRRQSDPFVELMDQYWRDGWLVTPEFEAVMRNLDPVETLAWLWATERQAAA